MSLIPRRLPSATDAPACKTDQRYHRNRCSPGKISRPEAELDMMGACAQKQGPKDTVGPQDFYGLSIHGGLPARIVNFIQQQKAVLGRADVEGDAVCRARELLCGEQPAFRRSR